MTGSHEISETTTAALSGLRVVLVSFSELPTLQKHMYHTYDELTKVGLEAYTLGSSCLRIDFTCGKRNIFVPTPTTPRPSPSSVAQAMRESKRLAKVLADCRPDVIHFMSKHTWNYFLINSLRKLIPGVRILHTFHDPIGHSGDSIQRGVILYNKVIQRRLDAIVVLSEIAERQVHELLKPGCPVLRVSLGECDPRDYLQPSQDKKCLVFGRLNAYKGLDLYPEILRHLYEIDPDVRVTIAGKPGDGVSKTLLDEIAELPNVDAYYGFVEENDLDFYFSQSDLVLAPYTSITQSGVIMDAYSHSRCVLAFDIDGIAEFIPNSALRVPAYDCLRYAETIASVLARPDELLKLSYEAWAFGEDNFTPAIMAASLAEAYKAVARR